MTSLVILVIASEAPINAHLSVDAQVSAGYYKFLPNDITLGDGIPAPLDTLLRLRPGGPELDFSRARKRKLN